MHHTYDRGGGGLDGGDGGGFDFVASCVVVTAARTHSWQPLGLRPGDMSLVLPSLCCA